MAGWQRRVLTATVLLLAATGIVDIMLGLAGRPPEFTMASEASNPIERAYVAAAGLAGYLSLYASTLGMRRLLLAALTLSALLRHIIPVLGAQLLRAEIDVNFSFVYNSVLAWLAMLAIGALAYETTLTQPTHGRPSQS